MTEKKELFWVYGDIHHHIESAQEFLDTEKPDKVIWLGDVNDRVDDDLEEVADTASWLSRTMQARPQDVWLWSNHALAYAFPNASKYRICGATDEKIKMFNEYFPKELWERFRVAHKEEWRGKKVVFTHAGLTDIFFHLGVFDWNHLERISKIAIDNGDREDYNPLFDHWTKGPMWMRWQSFPILEGVNQVCGHTTFEKPQIKTSPNGTWNLCLDCAHSYYACFQENGAFSINRRTKERKFLVK